MTDRLRTTDDVPDRVVSAAKAGDHAAFATLVRHYDARLRGLAFRLLGDRSAMDDALQEAYVKAYRALPRFDGRSTVGTWLYRITYNACLDHLRRISARPQVSIEVLAEGAVATGDGASAVAERIDLMQALGTLPIDQRTVLLLVDGEGFDYATVARITGVAEGTVGSRLTRARAAMRTILGMTEEDGR
jgi:RNA polymerase sigma-70 factor (ECF subfamily)